MTTNVITPEDRLQLLKNTGHENCLEAIRLRGGQVSELRAYITRLENGGGTNTLSYRRAERLLSHLNR